MIKMFCLRVKSTASPQLRGRFNVPFYAQSDEDAIAYIVNALKKAKDEAVDIDVSLFSLYSVGVFDFLKGIIKNKPKLITDIDQIPAILDLIHLS